MVISPDDYLFTPTGEYVWTKDRVKDAWRETYARTKSALRNGNYDKLVLLVGIPASGKSTWLKAHQEPNAIYIDATFTYREHRAPFIQWAKDYGKVIEAVVMDTPINVCLERNNCRTPDRKIPENRVVEMAIALQGNLPTVTEGFDKVIHVRDSSSKVAARYVASKA